MYSLKLFVEKIEEKLELYGFTKEDFFKTPILSFYKSNCQAHYEIKDVFPKGSHEKFTFFKTFPFNYNVKYVNAGEKALFNNLMAVKERDCAIWFTLVIEAIINNMTRMPRTYFFKLKDNDNNLVDMRKLFKSTRETIDYYLSVQKVKHEPTCSYSKSYIKFPYATVVNELCGEVSEEEISEFIVNRTVEFFINNEIFSMIYETKNIY